MTPQPQQQEYIITEYQIRQIELDDYPDIVCQQVRSRPTPAREVIPTMAQLEEMYAARIEDELKKERERVRPEVWQFALLMEKKLQENDHKEHWSKCNQEYLLKRLDEEVQELHKCFFFYSPGDMNFFMDGQHEDKIPGEAADVANFAMMLWDNFGEKESLRGEP